MLSNQELAQRKSNSRSALMKSASKVKVLESEADKRKRQQENREKVKGAKEMTEEIQPLQFLTVEDVAQYLAVEESTIYSWCQENKIPHIRLNRMIRFRKEDINEWLEARTTGK